jgi:hypothetical protein
LYMPYLPGFILVKGKKYTKWNNHVQIHHDSSQIFCNFNFVAGKWAVSFWSYTAELFMSYKHKI